MTFNVFFLSKLRGGVWTPDFRHRVGRGQSRPYQQSAQLSVPSLLRNHHMKLHTISLFFSELFLALPQGSRTAPLATVCSRSANFYRKGRFRIMLYMSSRGKLPNSLVCITAIGPLSPNLTSSEVTMTNLQAAAAALLEGSYSYEASNQSAQVLLQHVVSTARHLHLLEHQ